MATPTKVLFAVHSEHGQANPVLAVAHELATRRGGVAAEVHIASFAELAPRVIKASDAARKVCSDAAPFRFHELPGPSMEGALGPTEAAVSENLHEAGFCATLRAYGRIAKIMMCWTGAQWVAQAQRVRELSQELQPDVVVVDSLFAQGIDGALLAKANMVVLSPNGLTEYAARLQPRGEMLWKYPVAGVGWQYPLRWWQIPLNILLIARSALVLFRAPETKDVLKARKAADITSPLGFIEAPTCPWISACPQEMDYPLRLPDNIHGCGPFLLPSEPVESVDPELAAWLRLGPIVLINRGSHLMFSDAAAKRMARGLKKFREQRPDVRVLWKLKPEKDYNDKSLALIEDEMKADQIRVVKWLKADPTAIMRTGQVIAFANHGGANSWLEGASLGVPQVVLPGWFDCYYWASRAEYLGVGVWGNRRGGLGFDADELAQAFLHVCKEPEEEKTEKDGETSVSNRKVPNCRIKAKELAVKAGGSGSPKAVEIILATAQAGKPK